MTIAPEEELLEKKTFNKGDRKVVSDTMRHVLMEVESNLPFVLEQFSKATETMTREAKGELESFMTTTLQRMGLNSLKALQSGEAPLELPEEGQE